MLRVLLLLPTSTYRAPDFVRAATRLGVEVVVGSDEMPVLLKGASERAVALPLDDPDAGLDPFVEVSGGRARLTIEGRLLANEVALRLR